MIVRVFCPLAVPADDHRRGPDAREAATHRPGNKLAQEALGRRTMAFAHLLIGANAHPVTLQIRRITPADLLRALALGLDDFAAMPSHAVFLCVIYPLLGLWLISLASGYSMLPLAFPLAAGFALIGPFAAIGLYELSRRREAGLDTSSAHALDVLRSPSLGAIVALGLLLAAIFLVWLAVAEAIYVANFGYAAPASVRQFVEGVFTTPAGWHLIVVGTGVGFLFAALVLTIAAVSFPLLLDRDVGAAVALVTSIRVVAANPLTMAIWGFIVAALLVAGSVPFFLGLTVVMPVLGHATWHLYRMAVEPDLSPRPDYRPPERPRRYAADFPASLFPTRR
jgi:uncharacterized membrane protein